MRAPPARRGTCSFVRVGCCTTPVIISSVPSNSSKYYKDEGGKSGMRDGGMAGSGGVGLVFKNIKKASPAGFEPARVSPADF